MIPVLNMNISRGVVLVLVAFVCIGAVRLNEGVSQPERTIWKKEQSLMGKR